MSKRMVDLQVDGGKVTSIDGHDVGTGGVGDKSISRRMITYKVDDAGKITSIDGHELNGGGGYEIKPLTVTENGVYDVAGEAYKPVRVNVPQTAQSGTLKAVLDATQSARYLFMDYTGTSVNGLIGYNDTANVTNMNYMFAGCSKLTTIPQLDTSKVTSMKNMFFNCARLTNIPELITSNVTDMANLFSNCAELTEIPQLDTSKNTNMSMMFSNCSKLTIIPQLDASHVTDMYNVFSNCASLTSIGIYGFTRSINISATALGHDAIVALLNQAGTAYDSSQKITMGSDKLALLSDEEKAIATNKGWTLA